MAHRPLSARERQRRLETRGRVLRAIAYGRTGDSATRAARRAGTTLRTMRKLVPHLLQRGPGKRLHPIPIDRMRRPMKVLTPAGTITFDIGSSRSASRLARYWNAVRTYLRTGRTAQLREFRGHVLRVDKLAFPFLTDQRTLERLGHAGEFTFEELYDYTV